MSSCVLNIRKGNKDIACFYYKHAFDTIAMFEKVIKCVKNYNENLIDIAKDIPDKVLAHRILECDDVHRPMKERSLEYAQKNFPDYIWPNKANEDDNIIALIADEDVIVYNMHVGHHITIDLDNKLIYFADAFRIYSSFEYCAKREINEDDFDIESIPIFDFNISNIYFNQLEDFYEFIKKSNDFRCEKKDQFIYSSYAQY